MPFFWVIFDPDKSHLGDKDKLGFLMTAFFETRGRVDLGGAEIYDLRAGNFESLETFSSFHFSTLTFVFQLLLFRVF